MEFTAFVEDPGRRRSPLDGPSIARHLARLSGAASGAALALTHLRAPLDEDPRRLLSRNESNFGPAAAGDVWQDMRSDADEAYEAIEVAARRATRTVVDGFEQWLKGSLDVREALRDLARELSEIGLRKFVLDPFEEALSQGGDILGGGLSDIFDFGLGTVFGGGGTPPLIPPIPSISLPRIAVPLAEGGPVTAGDPFLVGERGPELFVPFESGAVIPNHQLGGETVVNQTITVHVHGGINNQGRMTPGQVAAQIGSELARQSRRNN